MKEKTIEGYLRDRVRAAGGRAYKFVSPGNNGVPDRLMVMPGGRIVFVELKSPGRKSTELQKAKQAELAKLGCVVFVDVDSKEKIDSILAGYARAAK